MKSGAATSRQVPSVCQIALKRLCQIILKVTLRGLSAMMQNLHLSRRSQRVGIDMWGFWVRLNGADHQWGKDPPKEVVG
jgi:hypothetical protein